MLRTHGDPLLLDRLPFFVVGVVPPEGAEHHRRDVGIVAYAVGVEFVEPVPAAEVHLARHGIPGVRILIELVALQPVAVEDSSGTSRCPGSNRESPLLVLIQRFPLPSSRIPRMRSLESPSFCRYCRNLPVARSSVLSPAAVPTQSAPAPVLVNGENERIAQAGAVARDRLEVGEGLRVPVEAVQAAPGRPDPQRSLAVLAQRPDAPGAQAARDRVVRDERRERSSRAVHEIEAVSVGADPEVAFAVLEKGIDPIVTQRSGVLRVVPEMGEGAGCPVEPVEPRRIHAQPEGPLPVLVDGLHPVVDDAPRIRRVVREGRERFAGGVQTREPAHRADPGRAAPVDVDRLDHVVDEARRVGRACWRNG